MILEVTRVMMVSISPSTILHHLRDSLALKPDHFRWLLHKLTCDLKEKRVMMCCKLLQMEETFGFAPAALVQMLN
jgi:hypothetical protein